MQSTVQSTQLTTYDGDAVGGTEAGVDGPGFPVLAQNLCVVRRVGFYQQTCRRHKRKDCRPLKTSRFSIALSMQNIKIMKRVAF